MSHEHTENDIIKPAYLEVVGCEGWRNACANLQIMLGERDNDVANLRETLAEEIKETRRLESALKQQSVEIAALKRKMADYTARTQEVLNGLEIVTDAGADLCEYESAPHTVLKVIRAYLTRQRRSIPEYQVDERGILSIHDDIPF